MVTVSTAYNQIKKPYGIWEILHENGNTDDIITSILYADKFAAKDTAIFSKNFKNNPKLLWDWVRKNIRYKSDPKGKQLIKSPAAGFKSKEADCKSMSLFIASILKNLNIPYKYRFTAPDDEDVQHVYVIANWNGKEIILDAVNPIYNKEANYHHAIDYTPVSDNKFKKSKISGPEKNDIISLGAILLIIYLIVKK